MDPIKTEKVYDDMFEEPYQEIQSSSDLSPGLRRELGQIEGRISNVLHISDDNVHEEAYQAIQCSIDLLPGLKRELGRINRLISDTQVLPKRLEAAKIVLQDSINILSTSKDAIDRLDEEACRNLLLSTKNLFPQLRCRLSETWEDKQPWDSSRIQLEESSHSTNPSMEVFMNDWYDYLHIELQYMTQMYLSLLLDKHKRLRELMSKDQVLAVKLEPLKFFLEKCMNLLNLRRSDIVRMDKKQFRRLVQMTKLFVVGALIKEYGYQLECQVWPCEDLCAISDLLQQVGPCLVFEAALSDDKCPPGGGTLSEGDWHHKAYKEILLIRTQYSSQLDEAYNKDYTQGRLCNMLARASYKFLGKSLEFLATSKAEIVYLSKEKCYYRMMLIKLFLFLTKGSVSANQNFLQPLAAGSLPQTSEHQSEFHQVYPCETASSNSMCHNQLESSRNCRDWVYEELRGIRKNYSSELDEAYRKMRGLCTQNPRSVKNLNVYNSTVLEEVLAFLGYTRADLALISEEECVSRLMRITKYLNWSPKFESAEQYAVFLKSSSDSTEQIQPESMRYWRDEVYAEIKSKKIKFESEVIAPCKQVHKIMSQTPRAATGLAQLGVYLRQALPFFTMNRCEIAICSEEEYDKWVAFVNENLVKVRQILNCLQDLIGRPDAFPCNTGGTMLKERSKYAFEYVTRGYGCNC